MSAIKDTPETRPDDMSAYDIEMAIQKSGVEFVPSHDCTICGVPVGWVICHMSGLVDYRSSCGCSYSPNRPSSYREMSETHNMQTYIYKGIHNRTRFRDKLEGKSK